MKTVYFIPSSELRKLKSIKPHIGTLQKYYKLGDWPLPFVIKTHTVYWREGEDAQQTCTFRQYKESYEYVELTEAEILNKCNSNNENRLQEQKIDVIRGGDTKGARIQGRKRKTTIAIGHLSYKASKG